MARKTSQVLLRLDPDLYGEIKGLAEEADVSVNQLVQGICRWAMQHAHVGEIGSINQNEIQTEDTPGCVWFGSDGTGSDPEDAKTFGDPGVYFGLDFTSRGAVRMNYADKFER